jgi:hypothetical protein
MRRRVNVLAAALSLVALVSSGPLARAQTAPGPYAPEPGQPPPVPTYAQPYPTTPYQRYPSQPYPYPPPYGYPYPTAQPVYAPPPELRPVRSGPSAATVAGAVLASTGGLLLVSGFFLWVYAASNAGVGGFEHTYDLYAHSAERDASNQRIGLGLLGSGAVLIGVGVITAVVGRSVERSRVAKVLRSTNVSVGRNGAALGMRF